ncbi:MULTISPECIES: LysE family translocator [Haloferax]|uniref:LysE family translocator n=1 Tax=Haloferax marinum TaxID=2666143 RepID=A0A6A8G5X4_9EURY|nr:MULTISPECIES: LysE family transporter [Haloferax]KAB1196953.1 LysE family translocator [Haloferax sp. CBA1150]MRW95972.1 LysE family translocator [Haloferax marinum]
MSTVLPSLTAGLVFGLALAAPPGPMNAVIAEESVVRGWSSGARAGLGAMSADALFFVLAALGLVAFVEQFPTIRAAMVGAGGLLMLYFAYGAAKETSTTFREAADPETDSAGFTKAFVLALTNPYQILFWLTIGVGLLETGSVDVLSHTPYLGASLSDLLIVQTGSPALILGFFGGIAVWVTGFPAALVAAEKRVESFAPVVAALSAVVLGGFGVMFLWDAVRTLV